MRMTRLLVIVAVVCLGVWTVSARGQQGQQSGTQQPGMSGQSGQQSGVHEPGMHEPGVSGKQQAPAPALMESPNEMQIQGKVLNYKDVDVQGDKEHRVVRVQTREGQVMMVDLGRKDRLPRGLDVREGQWVIVTGVQGRLGNDNVLVTRNWANVFNLRSPAAGAESGAQLEDKDQSLREKVGDSGSGTGGSQ